MSSFRDSGAVEILKAHTDGPPAPAPNENVEALEDGADPKIDGGVGA